MSNRQPGQANSGSEPKFPVMFSARRRVPPPLLVAFPPFDRVSTWSSYPVVVPKRRSQRPTGGLPWHGEGLAVNPDIAERAKRIRALALDVDGVLTDASLHYGRSGEALKTFSARDGFGIKAAQMEGIAIAVLSGRVAPPLKARLADLGIPTSLVIQGSLDKGRDIATLAQRLGLTLLELAFIGDDIPDLPAMAVVGLAVCPADAAAEVRARCHLVTQAAGGRGAVRETVEVVLRAQGRWEALVKRWAAGDVPERFGARARDSCPPEA